MGKSDAVAALAERIRGWRGNIPQFVVEMFDTEPSAQQCEVLRAMSIPGAHVSVASGHSTGKSTLASWLILHGLVCYPEVKIPCTAPSGHQLSDVLWSELALWHSKMLPWFKNQLHVGSDQACVKGREKLQFAVARTARREVPDALQGFHSPNLLFIVDEASGVPDEIYKVAEGALASHGARVLLVGNPVRRTGRFFDTHNSESYEWERFTLSSEDSPFASKEWLEKMERIYGRESDEYRVRVLGLFPRSECSGIIPQDLAERMVNGKPSVNPFAPGVLGVDPAWMGGDRSTIAHRQGLVAQILLNRTQIDNLALAGETARAWQSLSCQACNIDIGWGQGVIDILRGQGFLPTPVAFGGSPINSQRFANKATEIWWSLREWGERGGVILVSKEFEKDLIIDLTSFNYTFNVAGKLVKETKDQLKKRGGRSPDLAEAVGLTLALPLQDSAAPRLGKDLSRMSRAQRQALIARKASSGREAWEPFGDE